MRPLSLAVLSLVACSAPGYAPRSILRDAAVDPRAVRTAGCLEIGFSVRGDDPPVLRTHFGNPCFEPVAIDLPRLRVFAWGADGNARRLAFDDPRAEIVPLHLDAKSEGIEAFRLVGDGGVEISRICIDPRPLTAEAATAPPVCFAKSGALAWEVAP